MTNASTLHANVVKAQRVCLALEKSCTVAATEERDEYLYTTVEGLTLAKEQNGSCLPHEEMGIMLQWLKDQGDKTTRDTFNTRLQKKQKNLLFLLSDPTINSSKKLLT